MGASPVKSGNTHINNALLESTLLHVRTLLDFYEKPSRSTQKKNNQIVEMDDVLAKDYGFGVQKIAISSDDRERLNKNLAHLTYARTSRTPTDKQWSYNDMVLPVLKQSKEFLEHLLDNWLQENDEAIKNLTPPRY